MNLLFIANLLYPVLALTAMILISHMNRLGFIVFLAVEVLMFYIGLMSGQFGIMIMAILYCFSYIYAWRQWGKNL